MAKKNAYTNKELKEFKNGLEDNVKYPPSIYIGLFWDN